VSTIFDRNKSKEHTKCNFNRIDFIARNSVLMLPTEQVFFEQV
jgi:hypothetical protein